MCFGKQMKEFLKRDIISREEKEIYNFPEDKPEKSGDLEKSIKTRKLQAISGDLTGLV